MPVFEDGVASGISRYSSAAKENGAVVSAAPACFYGITARSLAGATTKYLMVFDSATAVANGTIPAYVAKLNPDSETSLTSALMFGSGFSNGIYVAASTTDFDTGLTLATDAKTFFAVEYSTRV